MPLCLSGMTMSLMALGQRVESTAVLFRNDLKISDSPPFGCFVNPNNAAGWLIVCLSASLFVTGIFLGRTPETDLSRTRSRSRRVQLRSWFISLMKFAGGLNAFQIGAGLLAVLLLAAIAGTLSRGGIVAGLVCISVFFGYGIQIGGRSFSLLAFLIVLFFGGMLLLFLQLDTLVISELQTLPDLCDNNSIVALVGYVAGGAGFSVLWQRSRSISLQQFALCKSLYGPVVWPCR